MLKLSYLSALTVALVVLAGCNLPRGGPLKSEIVGDGEQAEERLDIEVENVTRASVRKFNSWPSSGWHGHYHWFAAERGPSYNLISAGDFINLTLWDSSDNSLLTSETERFTNVTSLEVSPSGKVYIPYAEYVTVSGLTASQARELIQMKVSTVAPSVQVQLNVKQGVGNTAYLVSGVLKPGPVQLPNRNYSLLALLSEGGGISMNVANPIIKLIRGGKTYSIPAKELFADARKNVTVRGGDQIIVEEDERYFTGIGSLQNEEVIYFDKETITAMEAITRMGGLTDERANPQGLLILREYETSDIRTDGKGPPNEHVVFVIDLTSADGLFGAGKFQIRPSDIVIATESAVKPAQAVIALIGSAFAIANVF